MTNLHTFAWAGEIGDRAIAGLLGAVSGGLGSLVAGGGSALIADSSDSLPYRDRLQAGKYLLVVRAADTLAQQATQILRQFEPESIQGYVMG
jgi:aspartate oxidase